MSMEKFNGGVESWGTMRLRVVRGDACVSRPWRHALAGWFQKRPPFKTPDSSAAIERYAPRNLAGLAPGPLTFQIFGTASAGVPATCTKSDREQSKTPALK